MRKPLTENQRAVLDALREQSRGLTRRPWLRPMDIGARDASHHSATLKALEARGLVERRLRGTLLNMIGGGRGSYRYRITAAGLRALAPAPPDPATSEETKP